MDSTPIFDELRDLFNRSHGRLDIPGTFGIDAIAEVEKTLVDAERPHAKIVIAGGRGVGKTAFVRSVSDAGSLNVEAATDIGRITLHPDLVLYLFGTSEPPQSGYGGALGAVVLVDARRIEDAFATIAYFENSSEAPFIVAVNMFNGELRHELDEVREALALDADVPLMTCDARDPGSTATVLQGLVVYAMNIGVSGQTFPPERPA